MNLNNKIFEKNNSKIRFKDILRQMKSPLLDIILKLILLTNKKKMKKKKKYFSICAIFKDEGIYLEEWLKYHIILGTEKFYLYTFSFHSYSMGLHF